MATKKASPKKEEAKKASPKKEEKVLKITEQLFLVGEEVEVKKEKFLVEKVSGVEVVLKRKDYL